MPLYQGSGFWGGKQYQDLAELHLPGPAVVIDVRQGSDHDPPLIWNLAVELEDLTTEMRLNQVYRWRYLADCIDLVKLTPLRSDQAVTDTTPFVLTTSAGLSTSIHGAKELVHELGREHLDRVRNNRISAVRDRSKDKTEQYQSPANPEQITVRAFFVVDAEDIDSLVSAATYADWLKKWYHEDAGGGRSGRERRLSTLAICMNADSYRHHPYVLAQHLSQPSGRRSALDAVILMHTYGDDEAFIGGDIQSYQVELILYTLLLLSIEGLTSVEQEMIDTRGLSTYVLSDEYGEQPSIPWSIFMIGISSIEYSARWASRWLDYGLVAKIITIMQERKEVDQEDRLGRLHREVRQELSNWLRAVSEIVPDMLTVIIPELQVLDELQLCISSSGFGRKKPSAEALETFIERVSRLYVGKEYNTLENALESVSLIPLHLSRDGLQFLKEDLGVQDQVSELSQRLRVLISQATQIPASLFHGARGMLPRVIRQVAELTEAITKIREDAENLPDLHECYEQFKRQAREEQQRLEQLPRSPWSFLNSQQRQQGEQIGQRLCNLIQQHLEQIRKVIATRVALVLLQEAGLYDPDGKQTPYQKRLKRLSLAIGAAEKGALQQQQRAYERLKLSLSEAEVGISQQHTWLSLSSRKDLLQWEQIVESFEQLYSHLEATPTSLNLLMGWLLRLIGEEKPEIIMQQYLSRNREHLPSQKDELEREQLYALSTMLVDVLLLLEVVDFDIATIQPLLTQYIDLKDRSSEEPTVLEGNILGLQRIVKEAMLEQATRSTRGEKNLQQRGFILTQEQPIERVLAAWVNNQCANDPVITQTLARNGIFARLEENKIKPIQALDDLRERNRVLGYREEMAGDDRFYLLFAPSEASSEFLKKLDLLYSTQIRPVHFPDAEKLIYLHIHRLRHIMPGYFSPTKKQLSPNDV